MALRALTDGKMPVKCVPGRLAMARLRPGAFPGGNPWHFFSLHVSKKGPRTRKGGLRGKICAPCIQNELALARCARHVSEKPRKSPSEDTPREDLARKRRFSLHGPLESCTARESCHPASTKHPSARNPCAADQRQTALAPATTPPPSWQRTTHSIHGASGSHTANAPTPHRPATLRRQADVKSCAARAPQRQSAARGPTAPQHPTSPSGLNIHNGDGATRLDADPDATGATAPTPSAASGCPRRKRSPPHARISSSLRRGFSSFRRKRAPTIHIYPPLLWRGFPADAPRTAAFPCYPGERRSAPCACHGVPDRNRLPSAPRQYERHGNL